MGRYSAICSPICSRAMSLIFVLAIALVGVPYVATPLYAANGTWTSTTTGLWSAGGNWSGGTVADGSAYLANFSTIDITGDTTVHLDSARTIGRLTFGDLATASAAGWTLDNNGNANNTLRLSGASTAITVNELGGGKTATISLQLTGSAGLTKAGTGTLVLSGANTYTGITQIIAGTLAYGADNVIANDGVLVSAGTLSMGAYSDTVGSITLDYAGKIACSGSLTTTGSFWIGAKYSGSVDITNGGRLQNNSGAYIGNDSTATGVVNVSGSGSAWTNSGSLYVGYYGQGTLNITSGGSVSATNSYLGYSGSASDTATVDGAGSTWTNSDNLYVGNNGGSGKLNILNGGAVSAGSTYLYSGGTVDFGAGGGTLTTKTLYTASVAPLTGTGTISSKGLVSDLDLTFDGSATASLTFGTGGTLSVNMAATSGNGILGAGYASSGTITIKNGASLHSESGYLGYGYTASGIATVDGSGSTWTNSNEFHVGSLGSGTLSILNGGCVIASQCVVGSGRLVSAGIVTVDGNNSTWTCTGSLDVGDSGTGTVNQTGGATSVGNTLTLGKSWAGNGAYNLAGGTLRLKSLAKGSGTAAFNFGGGTLQASGTLSSSLPMTLTGIGGSANVNTNGYPVTLSGILSGPGGLNKSGANTLTLSAANSYTGRTTVTAGAIEFAAAAQNAVFTLGGADIRAGKMVFDYNGVTSPGTTILSLLTASCHGGLWDVGQFRDSTAVASGLMLGWFDNGSSAVTVMATYAGDFNLDGSVDLTDLNVWKANIGIEGPGTKWQLGDANYDGCVDGLDLDLWKSHFGMAVSAGGSFGSSNVVAVPEPGMLAMLAAGFVGLAVYAGRRRATD
jgi:fibronectin-binding autotransporter adhesin